jgi:hypothetical protein
MPKLYGVFKTDLFKSVRKNMGEYQTVLKRVGMVLIIVGVLDIGYMVYCIASNQSYSSSLNIFAVIAGIFLVRGSLRAARIVTWFSAFMLTGVLGATLVVLPFLQPFDLWVTEFRLNPIGIVLLALIPPVAVVLLYWVYKQLRSPSVVQARVAAGQVASPPKTAFFLGILLVAVVAAIMRFTVGGEPGAKAMQLAQAQLGADYKYHVTAMQWSDGHYRASVTAYNQREIKPVEVEWQQ